MPLPPEDRCCGVSSQRPRWRAPLAYVYLGAVRETATLCCLWHSVCFSLLRRKGGVRVEQIVSRTSWGTLTLQAGKSPTATPRRAELPVALDALARSNTLSVHATRCCQNQRCSIRLTQEWALQALVSRWMVHPGPTHFTWNSMEWRSASQTWLRHSSMKRYGWQQLYCSGARGVRFIADRGTASRVRNG